MVPDKYGSFYLICENILKTLRGAGAFGLEIYLKNYGEIFWKRFKNAFPTILFYSISFLLILLIFGVKYALVASTATTLFEVRYRKSVKIKELFKMIFMSLVLCILAFAATRNVVLCIILNFTVPFLLVFFQSSQFIPKGHFGYAMTFVFLELIPMTVSQFKVQLITVLFTSVLAAVCIMFYGRFFLAKTDRHKIVKNSLNDLAEILNNLADGADEKKILLKLYDMEQSFQKLAYNSNHHLYMPDKNKYFFNMYTLLLQRAVYLITDGSWKEEREIDGCADALRKLADFTKRSIDADDRNVRSLMIKEAEELARSCSLPEGRVKIFYRSYLHMSLMLLKSMEEREEKGSSDFYKIPWREVFNSLIKRLSTDSFEIRFALRLAIVMTITCTVSLMWDFEHTYWFPLHAFLLVQPSYEESAHRMMTRPIGTIIGCTFVHLVYPFLPGVTSVFVFSVAMVAIMYCCTPGTWIQPIFSTSSAVIMASLTVDEAAAGQLRIFYLLMAIILVMIVNRFFFPSKKDGQFKRNIRMLIDLQRHYWGIVQQSLRGDMRPEIAGEILAYFHMVYNEAIVYVKNLPKEEADELMSTMTVLWNMFSEVEQVICLVNAGEIYPEEYGNLYYTSAVLMERLKTKNMNDGNYPPDRTGFKSEVSLVLEGYMKNMNRFYGSQKLIQMLA